MISSPARVCDGLLFTVCIQAALIWLEQHREAVNAMNVFPVPDGDTGTNMWHTLQSAYVAIQNTQNRHVGQVSDALARGALRGARGNSGTILSMLMRGFANGLADHEVMDADALRTACQSAVSYAYATVSSVMQPVEGTILTVARLAAERVEESPAYDLMDAFELLVRYAHEALAETPRLLPVLKQAGVVDSGGYGLVTMLDGILRFLKGEQFEGARIELQPANVHQNTPSPDDADSYGYDVQFLMIGEDLPLTKIRQDISAMGWSPLVDGDDTLIKVHIHVHNPAEPLDYAIRMGVQLDDIVVENMQRQYLAYSAARSAASAALVDGVGVVTVAAGDGLRRLLSEYGAAEVIHGGQTMNPSVEEFVNAAKRTNCRTVIFLPNNRNLILTAEQAATMLPDRTIHVIHTRTIPQGMAALLAYLDNHAAPTETLIGHMNASFAHIVTLEVTTASRDVPESGIVSGQWLGLMNGTPVSHGADLVDVTLRLLATARVHNYELITVLTGADLTGVQASTLQEQMSQIYPQQTIEWLDGGQPLYPLLISVE